MVRSFPINGDDTELSIGDAVIESRTRWNDGAITQEFVGGPLKIQRTLFTATGGTQLVVALRTHGGGRGGQTPTLKYIYNRR